MPDRRKSAHPKTDQDMMRCVVDAKGDLVFISPALGWALGQGATALLNKPLNSMIRIVAALDSTHQSLDLADLQSGFYEVALLRRERDPVVIQARIDRVDAAGGRRFTVIWLDPEDKLKKQKQQGDFNLVAKEFAAFIAENHEKQETESTAAERKPDLTHISKADGELRHFLNLSNDLLGVYRRDMSFVRVNFAFNRVLGFADPELKLFPFIDLIHPEERDHIVQLMQKVIHAPLDTETRIDFECRARCKDGSYRWIEWIHKAGGEHIYIVGRDVTEIKQHEIELQRREAQLSEAQKIGRMGHWYWEVGQSGIEWSEQIYTTFGVDHDKYKPTIDNVSAMLLKRDLGRIMRVFQRALVRKRDYALEFSVRRPTGGIRYVRCEGRCKVNMKTGEVEALFGIMQDITERTQHEKQLREAKEAAESAYASKTRFLANMSHELRTPLNAIIGFSEMIQRQLLGPMGNARYLDYISGIRQSGEHLLDLINDILDMSKIEVGKYELYVEELNVGKIIRLAIHMVEGRAHEVQVKLVADDIPDDIHIMADRRAVMQILLNLMSNAVKFTKPGGTVDVRCFPELGGVAMVVSDTGVGIPREKLDVVTLPFEQVSSEFTRNHEGSGLGLAITKDLVELHGGTIGIDSEVGVGTIVTVVLPEKVPEGKKVQAAENAARRDLESAG
ncbi:MAG: putative signal transduction histidine kinase [Alphaproteobacteria bacterium]|nr:putative signal transduction histidine kinase [Alphaproteobacteria bacterium]